MNVEDGGVAMPGEARRFGRGLVASVLVVMPLMLASCQSVGDQGKPADAMLPADGPVELGPPPPDAVLIAARHSGELSFHVPDIWTVERIESNMPYLHTTFDLPAPPRDIADPRIADLHGATVCVMFAVPRRHAPESDFVTGTSRKSAFDFVPPSIKPEDMQFSSAVTAGGAVGAWGEASYRIPIDDPTGAMAYYTRFATRTQYFEFHGGGAFLTCRGHVDYLPYILRLGDMLARSLSAPFGAG